MTYGCPGQQMRYSIYYHNPQSFNYAFRPPEPTEDVVFGCCSTASAFAGLEIVQQGHSHPTRYACLLFSVSTYHYRLTPALQASSLRSRSLPAMLVSPLPMALVQKNSITATKHASRVSRPHVIRARHASWLRVFPIPIRVSHTNDPAISWYIVGEDPDRYRWDIGSEIYHPVKRAASLEHQVANRVCGSTSPIVLSIFMGSIAYLVEALVPCLPSYLFPTSTTPLARGIYT